jgi:hypothetical protein
MNTETISRTYKETITALIDEYGNPSEVPTEEQYLAGERLRAGYALIANPSTNPTEVFKTYSIDRRVWGFYLSEVPEESAIFSKRQKRTDKYQSIIDWTQEHLFEQVTANTIMEIGEISYPTALKFIGDRPDIFRKLKRGLYELRDPKADRKAV